MLMSFFSGLNCSILWIPDFRRCLRLLDPMVHNSRRFECFSHIYHVQIWEQISAEQMSWCLGGTHNIKTAKRLKSDVVDEKRNTFNQWKVFIYKKGVYKAKNCFKIKAKSVCGLVCFNLRVYVWPLAIK